MCPALPFPTRILLRGKNHQVSRSAFQDTAASLVKFGFWPHPIVPSCLVSDEPAASQHAEAA